MTVSIFAGIGMMLYCASAHAYVGAPVGPSALLGLLIGSIIGIVGGIALVSDGTGSSAKKILKLISAMLISGFLGAATGLSIGFAVDMVAIYNMPTSRSFRQNQAYERLPLRKAACGNDVAKVRELIARPLDDLTKQSLGRIAWDCSIFNDPLPSWHAEMFNVLLPALHAQYAQGQHRQSKGAGIQDYCDVLDNLIWQLNVEKMKMLQKIGLPLHCRDGRSHLTLEYFVKPRPGIVNIEERRAEVETAVELIGGPEGPLSQAISRHGESFLDQAIAHGEAFFIITALKAGVDPGRPNPFRNGRSAALEWTMRKFQRCIKSNSSDTLADKDVETIDKLMRPPTAKEINALNNKKFQEPILWNLHQFKECEDGGAAFFRYLKDHGADLGIIYGGHGKKRGILEYHSDIKPALLQELALLSASEIDRLAHPSDPATGERAEPLLDTAIRNKNTSLVNFLCQHGIDGCTAAGSNPGRDDPWITKSEKKAADKQIKYEENLKKYWESQECLDQCLPPYIRTRAASCPHCTQIKMPQQP